MWGLLASVCFVVIIMNLTRKSQEVINRSILDALKRVWTLHLGYKTKPP
jgi:hypothetical protein